MTDAGMDVDVGASTAALDDDLIDYDDEDLLDQSDTITAPSVKGETRPPTLEDADDGTVSERPAVVATDVTYVEEGSNSPAGAEMALGPEIASNAPHEDEMLEHEDDEPAVQGHIELKGSHDTGVSDEYLEDVPGQPEVAATEDQTEQLHEVADVNHQHGDAMQDAPNGEENGSQAELQAEPVAETDTDDQEILLAPVEELQYPEDLNSSGPNGIENAENTEQIEALVDHPVDDGQSETWDVDNDGDSNGYNVESDMNRDESVVRAALAANDGDSAEPAAASTEQAESLRQGNHVASDRDFHVVTVQYKGEEFPLFSRDAEGFFPEEACLALTIDQLLAGLRVELENELADEEELVLQIDELGLEYAESSKAELCSVTLSYILEVYNLLVKNQGHEGPRTLYTYLFTKTSTTKRFASLCESANAGRGLDEICQLFESPMPQGIRNEDAESIELYEQLDDFESVGKEAEEYDENSSADIEKAQSIQLQTEVYGGDEAETFREEGTVHSSADLNDDDANDATQDQEEEHFFQQDEEEQDDGAKANEARDAETSDEQFVEDYPQPAMADADPHATLETDLDMNSETGATGMYDDIDQQTSHPVPNAIFDYIATPSHVPDDQHAAPDTTNGVEAHHELLETPDLHHETDVNTTWDHEATEPNLVHETSPNPKRSRDDDEQDVGDEKEIKRQRS